MKWSDQTGRYEYSWPPTRHTVLPMYILLLCVNDFNLSTPNHPIFYILQRLSYFATGKPIAHEFASWNTAFGMTNVC